MSGTGAAMRPFVEFSGAAAIRGVFCDIDDTLTTAGKLTALAYAALEKLRASGRLVIPVTGRPAGWCDHIARMWPVDAVVGENGAFWFWHDGERLRRRFIDDPATRAKKRADLAAARERILREVPGTALASDQLYREADLAIDWCEDVPRLPESAVAKIVAIMREAGLSAKVSSIHVNGWFGGYDKLSTTRLMMRERFGVDLERDRERYLFVGDSPNDAPMFAYFPHSVGVANVCDFGERMPRLPTYVTEARCGEGFAELVTRVVGAGVEAGPG